MRRSLRRLAFSTALFAVASTLAAQDGAGFDATKLKAALEDVEESLHEDSDNLQVWQGYLSQLFMLQTFENREADAALPSASERRRVAEERRDSTYRRLHAEFPDNPALHLMQTYALPSGDQRADALRQLASRFPHYPEILEGLLRSLRQQGLNGEARTAAEAFLSRNPDRTKAFAFLVDQYERDGQKALAAELTQDWLAAFPDDLQANTAWYDANVRSAGPEDRLAMARQVMARLQGEAKARWCGRIKGSPGSQSFAMALDCYGEALLQIETESEAFLRTVTSYAAALGEGGVSGGFEALLAELPPERRDDAAIRVASSLIRNSRCGEAVGLLAGVGDLHRTLATYARSLEPCLEERGLRELVAETLSAAEASQARQLLRGVAEHLPAEWLEAALLARPEAAGESADGFASLAESLDVLYEKAGWGSKRIALLERWLAVEPAYGANRALALADLYLAESRPGEALRVLEAQASRPENLSAFDLQERLAGLLLAGDRLEDAEELARRMLASGGERGVEGHLLLARIHAARGDFEAAAGDYERFFSRTPGALRGAEEYAWLLRETGQVERLLRFLERRWQAILEAGSNVGHRDAWMADQLVELGLPEGALPLYEKRIASGDADAELLAKAANLAEDLGEWERALPIREQILDRAPQDPFAWAALARHHLQRGDPRSALEVVEAAFSRLPSPDVQLWILRADALVAPSESTASEALDRKALLEAIDVLRQASEHFEGNRFAASALRNRLADLYLLLGELGAEAAAGTLAEEVPPPPDLGLEEPAPVDVHALLAPDATPEAILALADALSRGTGGRVDRSAAHALYQRAEATADATAVVRVAGLRHLGRSGFERDPALAATLAAPHFAAVRRRAEDGDVKARYALGTALLVGAGTYVDLPEARRLLRLAAAAGEAGAASNVAWMYESGTGERADPSAALEWQRRAAELGMADAMRILAWHALAEGSRRDVAEGLRWLRLAASRRHPEAMTHLGYLLATGEHLPQDVAAGLALLREAAALGEPAALHNLGYLYYQESSVPKDLPRAAAYFARAADLGWASSQNYLGLMLSRGWGVEADPDRAADLLTEAILGGDTWAVDNFFELAAGGLPRPEPGRLEAAAERLRAAADGGNANAATALAFLLINGAVSAGEIGAGVRYASQGVEAGSVQAMRVLGFAHWKGLGVPENGSEALRLWSKAAAGGDSPSMYRLGWARLYGDPGPKDPAEGVSWVRRSAEAGNRFAQLTLARAFDSGTHGLRRDEAEALHWYRKAAAQGVVEARGWLQSRDLGLRQQP